MSAELRERIATLEEENRQLKALLAPTVSFPQSWGLKPQEAKLLAVLYCHRDRLSTERLRAAVIGVEADHIENYIHVILYTMRKKLIPFGVTIVTQRGMGLWLPPESRAIIQDALAAGTVA